MDFNDSPEEAAFRAEARAWLEKTLGPPASRQTMKTEGDVIAASKAYQAKKAKAGYVGLTWRKDGLEGSLVYNFHFVPKPAK